MPALLPHLPLAPANVSSAPRATRAMVHRRTSELAVIAGRPPLQVAQSDYEQAKRELTGESDADRQMAILDAPPVTADWPTKILPAEPPCAYAARTTPEPLLLGGWAMPPLLAFLP